MSAGTVALPTKVRHAAAGSTVGRVGIDAEFFGARVGGFSDDCRRTGVDTKTGKPPPGYDNQCAIRVGGDVAEDTPVLRVPDRRNLRRQDAVREDRRPHWDHFSGELLATIR